MYRALYRKWRPARFEDVVGQPSIVAALQNQIKTGRVGHAYLFTGTRGTGKTTCAKIFAKAVNCPNCAGGDPCGACSFCRGIDDGSILDVVEIDAASNNGVNNIRDLRDETAYTPSYCRYKVYIIDEVHMLTGEAFNALLKIMEEPPSHVLFILATTESHKVPATILSRCQRYQFERIQPAEIAARLAHVAEEEQISLTEDAADLIAHLADGALRDALSILDTCAGVSAEVDEELVRRMAGVVERKYLFSISDALARADATAALAEVAALRQRSVDLKRLCEELIGHYRSLMLAGLPGGQELLSSAAPEERQSYLDRAKEVSQSDAVSAIRQLGGALERMGRSADPRIELELALFAIAMPQTAPAPAAPSPAPAPSGGGTGEAAPAWAAALTATAPAAANAAPPAAKPAAPAAPPVFAPWPQVVNRVQQEDASLYPFLRASKAYLVGRSVRLNGKEITRDYVLIDGGEFFRDFIRQNKASQETLKKIIEEVSGTKYPIGPYEPPKQEQAAEPALEQTLHALMAQGVEVVDRKDD